MKAMPLEEEAKGPIKLDMASLLKLQETDKGAINLKVELKVDEALLAKELAKR